MGIEVLQHPIPTLPACCCTCKMRGAQRSSEIPADTLARHVLISTPGAGSIAGGSTALQPPTAPVAASITAAAEPGSEADVEDVVDTNHPEAEGGFVPDDEEGDASYWLSDPPEAFRPQANSLSCI